MKRFSSPTVWMVPLLLCACSEPFNPLIERLARLPPNAAPVDIELGCGGGGAIVNVEGEGYLMRADRETDGSWRTRYRVFAVDDTGKASAVLVDHTIDEKFLSGEDELVLPFSVRGTDYELRVSVDAEGNFECDWGH